MLGASCPASGPSSLAGGWCGTENRERTLSGDGFPRQGCRRLHGTTRQGSRPEWKQQRWASGDCGTLRRTATFVYEIVHHVISASVVVARGSRLSFGSGPESRRRGPFPLGVIFLDQLQQLVRHRFGDDGVEQVLEAVAE